MADPMLGNRGRITRGLLVLLGIFTLAIIFYGVKVALAWHMPDVEITSPSNGDTVSGTVGVTAEYSVSNGNVHTLQLLIDGGLEDSVAVHQQSGTYTFNWDTTGVADGLRTVEVRAYTAAPPSDHFNSDTIVVTVSNCVIACTHKGEGVSFIKDRASWHHRVPTDEELSAALEELRGAV